MASALRYQEIGRCEFPPDPVETRAALGRIETYLRARGIGEETWNELELALAEGINNAVEHGCARSPEDSVQVCWSWDADQFHVEISDPSDFAGPSASPELAAEEDLLAEGGHGMTLISELVENVTHRREGNRHVLSFTKRVGMPAWGSANAADSEKLIQAITADLSNAYENLSALFRFAETLATSSSFEEFLDKTLARLLKLIRAETALLRFADAKSTVLEIVQTDAAGPKQVPISSECSEARVFRSSQEISVEERSSLPETDPLSARAGSAFVCVVQFRGEPIGVLTVLGSVGFFSAGELSLIRLVADYVGLAKAKSDYETARVKQEKAARELEIAASIQQSLLPRNFPSLEGFRIYGSCLSAQEIGGDFFDVVQLGDNRALILIADVMGKGVPAALLARMLRTALRSRVESVTDPGLLLTALNRQLAEELANVDMFITAQLLQLDARAGAIYFANAGHGPVLRRAAHRIEELEAEGIPLGIFPDVEYVSQRYVVEPGERCYLVTDGLYEATDPGGEALEMTGLAEILMRDYSSDLQKDCSRILEDIRSYTQTALAHDDRTIVVLERSDGHV